ncbi:universal stress protein UspA-like protein [Sulfuricella denitrificans skB26]|uniref:Universal stress protein UspA-like protein n=1 Tax=Sulfuricella denitrificans (strain DSM 22764 / NBRC 105220 / skB26) TaxID=1163617 RepID=S6AAG7_SULDS|nr:universal stress protein [Sulfuricella denitrificans]BAN35830.1 universal stress protein UspA-like protein [Sulfuricella denitrificans skB26]
MGYKILLPIDGSEGSSNAARHLAHIASMLQGAEVHLLNVQPPGDDWMVRRMIKTEELATLEKEWGEAAIAPARSILNAAGISCQAHIVQGEVATTIARLAQELGCDQIMMGTRGRSALGDLFLGSVAIKVLHLSSMPVTLVK